MMASKISIPVVYDSFTEYWSPRRVAKVNNQEVRIAKVDGEFIWHTHQETDELFYLLEGKLTLEMEVTSDFDSQGAQVQEYSSETGERFQYCQIEMETGDMLVVPKGCRHRPVANKARIMMVERQGEVNTGNVISDRTKEVVDIRKG